MLSMLLGICALSVRGDATSGINIRNYTEIIIIH